MNRGNVLTAIFTGPTSVTTGPLRRYDYGQVLKVKGLNLPASYEVHFAMKGDEESITCIGTSAGVLIPDNLLEEKGELHAFIYLHIGNSDGETEYEIIIPIKDRAKPSNATPTEHESSEIAQTLVALNSAVAYAEDYADSASDSATLSESYAVGGTNTRQDEETTNAKYYAEAAEGARDTILNMSVSMTPLSVGSTGYSTYEDGNLTLYIPDGATGPKGEKGDKGDKGDTGATGPKGDKGDTGATGVTGPKGDKGDKGDTGAKGDKGDTGATGAQGPKGDKGDTGEAGPKGDKGDTGATGPKGDKGDTGAQGPKGDTGITPDISIGTITTGNSSSEALVVITGTPEAPILNMTIPRGEKGEQGEKGDPGEILGPAFHICTMDEYNSLTRMPTIQDPEDGTFYLVPTADATSPDLFTEWVYLDNAWEMFGSATVDLSDYMQKSDLTLVTETQIKNMLDSTPSAYDATNGTYEVGDVVLYDNKTYVCITAISTPEVFTSSKWQEIDDGEYILPVIDDTAGDGDTTKVWSADKLYDLETAVSGKYVKPSGGIPSTDLASGVIPDVSGFYTKPSGGIPDADIASASTWNGKYAKPSGGIPASDLASGVIPTVPEIDDTAGDGDTNKVWSADKVYDEVSDLNSHLSDIDTMISDEESTATAAHAHAIKTVFRYDGKLYMATAAIAVGDTIVTSGASANVVEVALADAFPHDVQIDGTSIVNDGVANITFPSWPNAGVVKVSSDYGISVNSVGTIVIARASGAYIKEGRNVYKPVVPENQHISAFYGLAKAAGDSTQSASSNAVGTYTDEARIAIQKMLGIYEAPWELIREDTFTNATEADHEITVDGNGNAFELTDIRLFFQTPNQDTQATVGNYGRVYFYYNSSEKDTLYLGAYTQNANTGAKTGVASIEQKNGMIQRWCATTIGNNSNSPVVIRNHYDANSGSVWEVNRKTYNKIVISAVTGTGKYKLYGKRKWTT